MYGLRTTRVLDKALRLGLITRQDLGFSECTFYARRSNCQADHRDIELGEFLFPSGSFFSLSPF